MLALAGVSGAVVAGFAAAGLGYDLGQLATDISIAYTTLAGG